MYGRSFKGKAPTASGGCGECCTPGNVCAPKLAGGIGEVSMQAWLMGSNGNGPLADDRANPTSKWFAGLLVNTTHAGSFRFEFTKVYTKTMFLPSGQLAEFWEQNLSPKTYFSEPVAVHFTALECKIFTSPIDVYRGGSPLISGSTEHRKFKEAFGGLDPFAVSLTVQPITSIIPDLLGTVQYPSTFSDYSGFPEELERYAANVYTLQDALEVTWATNPWYDHSFQFGYFAGQFFYQSWGAGLNYPSDFNYFTVHPRGYSFLPHGLGPLDDPIHQFGHPPYAYFDFSLGNYSYFQGECYPNRLNDFFGPLTITLSNVEGFNLTRDEWNSGITSPPLTPADRTRALKTSNARYDIHIGINDTYECEWANTDGLWFHGRGTHWLIHLAIISGYDQGFNSLMVWNHETGLDINGSREMQLRFDIELETLHTSEGTRAVGQPLIGETPPIKFDDLLVIPGVSSYREGDRTFAYISDPTEYARAISATMTWRPDVIYEASNWQFGDFSVSIA